MLCHFFPIAATSEHWMEVGEEIGEIRVAYNGGDSIDEESTSGYEHFKEGEGSGSGAGAEVGERMKDSKFRGDYQF